MKIITLTLSPAFDVHCSVAEFRAEHENLVQIRSRDVGGKGVNIARALAAQGVANTPLVVLGSENADDFLRGMDACGLTARITMTVNGRIRENITIHPTTGTETRISFQGFTASYDLLDEVFAAIAPDADTLVTFTGSLPKGIGSDEAERFLSALQAAGARLVIDSKSIPLESLLRLKPWLIKPNEEELEVYCGALDFAGIVRKAEELHAAGIENALISLGAFGAVLACAEGVFVAKPPQIKAVSTIGAGDAMIAGFIAAKDADAPTRLRTAAALGTAAYLTEGTNPPKADTIGAIFDQVSVQKR